jgi:hypothetical protein
MPQPIVPATREHCKKLCEESLALRKAAKITVREARVALAHSRQTMTRIQARKNSKLP